MPEEKDAIEQLIAGKSDLNYTMAVEIVPPITLADFKTIKLTKLTSEVTDAEVEEGIARIAEQAAGTADDRLDHSAVRQRKHDDLAAGCEVCQAGCWHRATARDPAGIRVDRPYFVAGLDHAAAHAPAHVADTHHANGPVMHCHQCLLSSAIPSRAWDGIIVLTMTDALR